MNAFEREAAKLVDKWITKQNGEGPQGTVKFKTFPPGDAGTGVGEGTYERGDDQALIIVRYVGWYLVWIVYEFDGNIDILQPKRDGQRDHWYKANAHIV